MEWGDRAVRRDGVPPGYAPKPTHPHREENAGIAHRTAKRPHTQRIATNRNGTRRPVRGDEHRDSSRQGGQGHFLELGPRAGGNMIPIQLSDIWGIDLVRANVQAAMGETPEFIGTRLKALPGCHMHYVLHSYEAGRFQNIDIDDSIRRFVYREVIYKKEGDTVEVFDGAGKALGILFLHFDTPEEMEHFCKNHNSLINIVLQK